MIRTSYARFSTSNENTPVQESQPTLPTFNHLSLAKPMRRMSTFLMDKVLSPGSRRNSFSNRKNMSIDEDEDNDIAKGADVNEVGKRCNETNLSDDKNCRQYVINSNGGNVSDSPTSGCCGTCLDCTL